MTEGIFRRTISPAYRMRISISFSNGRLSLSGSYHGSYGQILDCLSDPDLKIRKGFTADDILKIHDIWKRWHLNDMRAGTLKQEKFVRDYLETTRGQGYNYEKLCEALAEANLLYDNGYKYGSAWLFEEVPDDVIDYLFSLPSLMGDSISDIRVKDVSQPEFLEIIN